MPILISWVVFCFFYLTEKQGAPLYSTLAEVALVGAAGFAVYGFGWVYSIFWSKISSRGFFLQVYKSIWWPISPLFFIFADELDKIGPFLCIIFGVFSVSLWFIFKETNYGIFEKTIKQNEKDNDLIQNLKFRSDLLWFDILYWGSLSWYFFI
jgi:hypothetical protein